MDKQSIATVIVWIIGTGYFLVKSVIAVADGQHIDALVLGVIGIASAFAAVIKISALKPAVTK